MKNNILLNLILLALFLYIAVAPAFADEEAGIRHEAQSFKLEGFDKAGAKEWEIEGDSAEMVGDKVIFVKLKATGEREGAVITLTADKGFYDRKKGEVELEGNVNASTSDGGVLMTGRAYWNTEKEEVTTDDIITVEKDGILSKGKGAVAKPGLKKASLKEDITVQIPPSTTITCDGPFDIYYEEGRAVFNNNVTVSDKDGTMQARELTAFFDVNSHELTRVLATGGVKIVRSKDSGGGILDASLGN